MILPSRITNKFDPSLVSKNNKTSKQYSSEINTKYDTTDACCCVATSRNGLRPPQRQTNLILHQSPETTNKVFSEPCNEVTHNTALPLELP